MRFRKSPFILLRDRRGSVTLIGALILPVMIGFAALVVEYGHGLVSHAENQRVADLSAYAGALAYASSGSEATMTSVARSVAVLNGVPADDVTPALVASPATAANKAVSVRVETEEDLFLAPVLGVAAKLPVKAGAFAEIGQASASCILALGSSGGITLSGGTAVSAPNCAVSSNASVSVPCGTSITAKTVTYNTTVPSQPCNSIKNPAGAAAPLTKVSTPDPLAGNAAVAVATGRVSTVSALSNPAAPTVPAVAVSAGTDLNFPFHDDASFRSKLSTFGCPGAFASNTWTLTCPSGRTFKIGALTVGGGLTVKFNLSGTGATTFSFSGALNNAGTLSFGAAAFNFAGTVQTSGSTSFGNGNVYAKHGMTLGGTTAFGAGNFSSAQQISISGTATFGAGTYKILGGLKVGGGANVSFGAGTFSLGAGSSTCDSGGTYSLCNTGASLTFGGPSTFSFTGGAYNKGGSTLVLGSGGTNSFKFGASSDGHAFFSGGSSQTRFAATTSGTTSFQMNGHFNLSGGGSCTWIGAAAQHDIDGNFIASGGVELGSGVYTVNGYIGIGTAGGGNVSCGGTTLGVSGSGVTLVTSGKATVPAGVACAGQAFCIGAGYSSVSLTAPTAGTTAKLVLVGPASATAGAMLAEGASGISMAGVLYFPKGPISLGGGASIGGNAGQCLQIVGARVSLSGGTTAASTCISTGGTGAAVALVQ